MDSGPLVLLHGLRQAKDRFGSWLCKNAGAWKIDRTVSWDRNYGDGNF
jgi:hypothetical protein